MSKDFEQISLRPGFMKHNGGLLFKTISENEINKGKAQLKANLLMARERANSRCRNAANQLLYFNRVIEPEEITKKIDKVTKDTVERIAHNILKTPMTIASIGPIKKLETLDKIQNRLN